LFCFINTLACKLCNFVLILLFCTICCVKIFSDFVKVFEVFNRSVRPHLARHRSFRYLKKERDSLKNQARSIIEAYTRRLTYQVRGPQSEIVAEELHDERGVLVGLLVERVELGDGVVEGRLGQATRSIRRVEYLEVEHGEVERQAQANRVRGYQLADGNVRRGLVRDQAVLGGVLATVARRELGQVALVVALHLVVEHLRLACARVRYQVLVQQAQDVAADLFQLLLNLKK
jgi:hypothetical protein